MPRLILFVGVPGSGKTTFYEKHKNLFSKSHIYLSLDYFRKLILGRDYFAPFEPVVKCWIDQTRFYLMNQKVDLVFDATNVSKSLRSSWLRLAKDYGYDVECFFFDVSYNTLLERDRIRSKPVGELILRRMTENFEEPTLDEGFSKIHRIVEDCK